MSGISVLICTYNRPAMLGRCLTALLVESREKPTRVVIVNGGDERADAIAAEYQSPRADLSTEVILIKTANKNLAASRNVGLPHCTGDLIAMTDDDAEVFPNWIEEIKRLHQAHPEAGVIGGAVIGAGADSLVSRVSDQVTFPNFPTGRTVRSVPGVNVSYKRQVIEQVGLQDETLFRGEDVDYNWRAQKLGWTVRYEPSLKVLHHHRPTLRGLVHQHYMYGRAYYLVRRKWQEMYCVYPHSVRSGKDALKAANFVAAAFYEPFQYAGRMSGWGSKLASLPILFANQVAWRGGMVRQGLASR